MNPMRLFRKKEPSYEEKWNIAMGKSPDHLGGYARMTRGYNMRKVRDIPKEMQADNLIFYNHLSWMTRFFMFFKTKQKRLMMCFVFALTFNYTGNIGSMMATMVQRTYKGFWNEYKIKKFSDKVTYQSAIDTKYAPKEISSMSTDAMCTKFIEVDRKLKNGLSLKLI